MHTMMLLINRSCDALNIVSHFTPGSPISKANLLFSVFIDKLFLDRIRGRGLFPGEFSLRFSILFHVLVILFHRVSFFIFFITSFSFLYFFVFYAT